VYSEKILIENMQTDIWKWKIFLHEFSSKRWFRTGIHSLRRPSDENK